MRIPRIVLAGTSSGVGKTSVACSIIYALNRQGYSVQPFKIGPDYIDPGYLSSIAGQDACNLDAWLMGEDHLLESFVCNSASDISVVEGVMGYYDGFGGDTDYASTHHAACITETPVVLILDASKAARSVAATAMGFATFHEDSRIAGVILNKVGSDRHEQACRVALEETGIQVFGSIPRDPALDMESRHLGLVSTLDRHALHARISTVAQTISEYLDINKMVQVAQGASHLPDMTRPAYEKPKTRIGVALDTSFNFYYRDNLEALRRCGATLEFFSPVTDIRPPECDGLYIGGGFPEVLGDRLAGNRPMQEGIRHKAEDGLPIYAECGGLMYLTRQITTDGKRHKMVGIFDAETEMTGQMTLGYTKGEMAAGTPVSTGPCGFRGHEFHYSRVVSVSPDSKFAYKMDIGQGIDGSRDGMIEYDTLASYGHLYFDSSDHAGAFVRNCARHSRR